MTAAPSFVRGRLNSIRGPVTAILVACLLAAGQPAYAQHSPDAAAIGQLPVAGLASGGIRSSIERAARDVAQNPLPQSPAVQLPQRSWVKRHPVLTGALVGTAAGLVIDAAGCNFNCGFYTVGAGAGAFIGLLAAAKKKPAFSLAGTSVSPDPSEVETVVRALGIDERVLVSEVGGREISGMIVALSEDTFMVQQKGSAPATDVRYQDVRSVRKQPLGTVAKVGLGLTALSLLVIAGGVAQLMRSY